MSRSSRALPIAWISMAKSGLPKVTGTSASTPVSRGLTNVRFVQVERVLSLNRPDLPRIFCRSKWLLLNALLVVKGGSACK
mmetsp:Transcript_18239/g.42725  ORF Transcript_18239/g.42725 Transcript_18239/m.42725 type:complete len:81 (-) Transcript_18239:416-658(-)